MKFKHFQTLETGATLFLKITPKHACITPDYNNRAQNFGQVAPLHGSWKELEV